MGLTAHQNDVLNQAIIKLIYTTRLLIKGSAGVGKTYMVNELIKTLRGQSPIQGKIICSAPTNKALAVIKGKVTNNDGKITFATVHSTLKLRMHIDRKSGKMLFKPSFDMKYPPLKNVSLFIIDEASMVNKELLGYIETYAKENNTKVIFIGDEKQLNPVGENDSPVFISNYPEVELTEIIRQGAGNPIIDLSRNLSTINSRNGSFTDHEDGPIGFIYSYDKAYIIEKLAEENGSDNLKYLAWTNKEVDSVNDEVRKKIYTDPKKLEEGESIVFNTPYKDKFFTNEEVGINDIIIRDVTFNNIFPRNTISTKDMDKDQSIKCYIANEQTDQIVVVHEDDESKFRVITSALLASCKSRELDWSFYYDFLSKFADFKYNHALSVHKSQGSTYKKAVVNVKNIMLNRNSIERERLLYTAVTRASDLLILYNT